jgi:hypothetical protein
MLQITIHTRFIIFIRTTFHVQLTNNRQTTNTMEKRPWEADSRSGSREFPHIFGTRAVIAALTTVQYQHTAIQWPCFYKLSFNTLLSTRGYPEWPLLFKLSNKDLAGICPQSGQWHHCFPQWPLWVIRLPFALRALNMYYLIAQKVLMKVTNCEV